MQNGPFSKLRKKLGNRFNKKSPAQGDSNSAHHVISVGDILTLLYEKGTAKIFQDEEGRYNLQRGSGETVSIEILGSGIAADSDRGEAVTEFSVRELPAKLFAIDYGEGGKATISIDDEGNLHQTLVSSDAHMDEEGLPGNAEAWIKASESKKDTAHLEEGDDLGEEEATDMEDYNLRHYSSPNAETSSSRPDTSVTSPAARGVQKERDAGKGQT